jgi:hypothetical protein
MLVCNPCGSGLQTACPKLEGERPSLLSCQAGIVGILKVASAKALELPRRIVEVLRTNASDGKQMRFGLAGVESKCLGAERLKLGLLSGWMRETDPHPVRTEPVEVPMHPEV